MSRTDKDLPDRVKLARAKPWQLRARHDSGCTSQGCTWTMPQEKTPVTIGVAAPAWYLADVQVASLWTGTKRVMQRWQFAARPIVEDRRPKGRTHPCDLPEPGVAGGRCHWVVGSRDVGRWVLPDRHRCFWPKGMKRAKFYGPERRTTRETLAGLAAEYNTFGQVLSDDPWSRPSPSGLWGGGWVD